MDFEAKTAARLEDERPVGIAHGQDFLTGSIARPPSPHAVAVIANDRGCARHVSPLLTLSRELRREGLATLLLDVARSGEDRASEDVLAARIDSGRAWLTKTNLRSLPLVLIGMGDAAPAALLSAAARPSDVAAVVACGRDPAAAGIALGMISAPTLLVARSGPLHDIGPYLRALAALGCERELVVLNDAADGEKHALDVVRAIVAFVSRSRDRAAA